jgi:hypothetical protein
MRKRWFAFLFLFIVTIVVLISVFVHRGEPTRDNYDRIQIGMSHEEVELLMGETGPPRPWGDLGDPLSVEGFSQTWFSDEDNFTLFYVSYSPDGKVVAKRVMMHHGRPKKRGVIEEVCDFIGRFL